MFLYHWFAGPTTEKHETPPPPNPNPNNLATSSLLLKVVELRRFETNATETKPQAFQSVIQNVKQDGPVTPTRDFIAEREARSLADKKDEKIKADDKTKKEGFIQNIIHQLRDVKHGLKIDEAIKQVYQEKIAQIKKIGEQLIEQQKTVDTMSKEQVVEACYLGKRYSEQLGVMLNDILGLVEDEIKNKSSLKKIMANLAGDFSKTAAEILNVLPEHEVSRGIYHVIADYLAAVGNSADQVMVHCGNYLKALQTQVEILKKPLTAEIVSLPRAHTSADSKAAAFNRKRPISLKFTTSSTTLEKGTQTDYCSPEMVDTANSPLTPKHK